MEKIFPRALFGYDRAEVENRIISDIEHYENRIKELSDQLYNVTREIELLQEKIRQINDEFEERERLNQKIMKELFDSHDRASKEVFAAIKEGQRIIRKSKADIFEKETKRLEIKKALESLTKEMETITNSYKKVLEAYGDDGTSKF